MKKKISYSICAVIVTMLCITGCGDPEKKKSEEQCNAEISRIEKQLSTRDEMVESAETFVKEEKPALDGELVGALETAISNAKAITFDKPEVKGTKEEIDTLIQELKKTDYQEELDNLKAAQENLDVSRQQYELVNAPNEAFVIERLERVENMGDIAAATEDNDPNGNLNKQGGYTAQIYFSTSLIDQSEFDSDSVIDKGTDCGGSIEVYKTEKEALVRNEYLAAFDGGIFASGSHTVVGTVLIRTSDKLTASQQQALETSIVASLTTLE